MGDVSDESETARKPKRRIKLLLIVASVVLVLDVVTKVLAVRLLQPGKPVPIIGDTVTWTLVRNSGAAFSFATGYTWVLTLIAISVVVGILFIGRRLVSTWWAIGLGMILGGALGNLVDRFFRGPDSCAATWWTSCPWGGGRSSMSRTPPWWVARFCWWHCRCSVTTTTARAVLPRNQRAVARRTA